jgi:branched-chain amino acid transport system ATP-binding protein
MTEPLLSISHVRAGYGASAILYDASIEVMPGEIVGLVGHNGAGKTTLLRAAMGLVRPWEGEVHVKGVSVLGEPPHRRVVRGVGYVPDGRQIFANLTVAQNLALARALSHRAAAGKKLDAQTTDTVRSLFPILAEREKQHAGLMSGGEQQMLSIAMALVSQPDLVILDEPTIGLSPKVADEVLRVVAMLGERLGAGVLIVEQNVRRLLDFADRVEVMKLGRTIGPVSSNQVTDEELWSLF